MTWLRASTALVSAHAVAMLAGSIVSCAAEGDEPEVTTADASPEGESTVIPNHDAGGLETCIDSGWCAIVPPIPAPFSFNGIWGSSAADVWLVGSRDGVLHWTGTEFQWSRLGTDQTVLGIWGSGPSDIWAFSSGLVLFHSGGGDSPSEGWSGVDAAAGPITWPEPVAALWGSSATDIWGVGPWSGRPTVWHSDGWQGNSAGWVAAPISADSEQPSFNAVWVSPAGEAWVVGNRGKTRHGSAWNDGGTTWTVVDSLTSLSLFAVWGSGNDDVWAAGAGGVMRRFTPTPDGDVHVAEVPFPSWLTVHAIFGLAADDVWAAGDEGLIAHWDGATWSLVDVGGLALRSNHFYGIWGSSPNDLWIAGYKGLLHKGDTLFRETKR